jgi:hypothetical protein
MNILIIKKLGMAFPQPLCEEMIFPLPSGKNENFVPQSIIFPLVQWKYNFFTQKVV